MIEAILSFSVLGTLMLYSGYAVDGATFESSPFTLQVATPNAPIYERVRLGSSNRLRGFRFRDAGPDMQAQIVATVILDPPTLGKAVVLPGVGGGGAFWDLSSALYELSQRKESLDEFRGADFSDTGLKNPGDLEFLVKRGIRIDLPIGPVRVDFAIPITSDRFNDSGEKFDYRMDAPGPGYRRMKGESH